MMARAGRRIAVISNKKPPRSIWNGVVLLDSVLSVLDSGLADLVHVANEVEHLVGEAPLVRGCLRRPRRMCSDQALIPQGFFVSPSPAAELDQAICYYRCPNRRATFYTQNCII